MIILYFPRKYVEKLKRLNDESVLVGNKFFFNKFAATCQYCSSVAHAEQGTAMH